MAIQPFFALSTDTYFVRRVHQAGITQTYAYTPDPSRCRTTGVPDGSIDIQFDFYQNDVRALVLGPVPSHNVLETEPGHFYFGIRFDPGVLPPFIDGKFRDFCDQVVPLDDCITDRKLEEDLIQSHFMGMRTDILLQAMHYHVDAEKDVAQKLFVDAVIQWIVKSKGCIRMDELAVQMQYSTRYIDKVFSQTMGISPKQFSQAIRFQNTLSQLTHGRSIKMVDLAQLCGYYDQSQMTRYFKSATGLTPKKYRDQIVNSNYESKFINC
jgi:AraC-like DNA-binding protein